MVETKGMPVFVKVDEYKEVLDILSVVKSKLSDARNLLDHVMELKEEEDNEIDSWKLALEDIEKKMSSVNSSLFEPENL